MPVPERLSWAEAGGTPECFTTAHDAVFTQGQLLSGERLLVHGGAGGVGTAAIQLGNVAGARVTATVRNPDSREQVAQLIRADLGLEVACVDIGGWDTHSAQGSTTGTLADNLADLAAGLQAFYTDLADRRGHITVVTMSEFGRRVKENASGGTDHGHGNCMFLLGGGVAGGKVYSSWPGLAAEQLYGPGDLAITTDFRTVLAEVVERRLGNPKLDQVFPGFTHPAYLGVTRPAA